MSLLTGGIITSNSDYTLVNSGTTSFSVYGLISNLKLTKDKIIEAANGTLTLDAAAVTNNGAINVASGAVLTLENGTLISGGTMTIAGTLEE